MSLFDYDVYFAGNALFEVYCTNNLVVRYELENSYCYRITKKNDVVTIISTPLDAYDFKDDANKFTVQNSSNGLEFSYSVWIYIQDWTRGWKNILVNIAINDNTLPNISNTNRDDIYQDLYSKLTAFNFIEAVNDIENKYVCLYPERLLREHLSGIVCKSSKNLYGAIR